MGRNAAPTSRLTRTASRARLSGHAASSSAYEDPVASVQAPPSSQSGPAEDIDRQRTTDRRAERETFLSALETLETAPLPNVGSYRITVAIPTSTEDLGAGRTGSAGARPKLGRHQLNDEEVQRFRIQGQEALSDALRPGHLSSADKAGEGVVWSQWVGSGAKRRRLVDDTGSDVHVGALGQPHLVGQVDRKQGVAVDESMARKVPMWYTVPLRYPCTCQLPIHPYARTPALKPPLASALHPLPPHAHPHEAPREDGDVPPWNAFRLHPASQTLRSTPSPAAGPPRAPFTIAELATQEIEEDEDILAKFESTWHLADGGWGRSWTIGDTCDIASSNDEGHARIDEAVSVQVGIDDPHPHAADARKGPELPAARFVQGHAAPSIAAEIKNPTTVSRSMRHTRSALRPSSDLQSAPSTSIFQQRRGSVASATKDASEMPSEATPQGTIASGAEGPALAGIGETWAEEAKRRKQLWRGMIERDKGYGRMWDSIPMPHTRSATFAPSHITTELMTLPRLEDDIASGKGRPARSSSNAGPPPNFVLPRALAQVPPIPHPFHPDLIGYMTKYPTARVYWVIPVNGPVVVRGVNDHDLPGSATSKKANTRMHSPAAVDTSVQPAGMGSKRELLDSAKHPLCPSTAHLAQSDDLPSVHPLARPFPLLWTPTTLLLFWQRLCSVQEDASRMFGGLSVVLSGPKPDPYLDLPLPSTMMSETATRGASGTINPIGPKRHRGVLGRVAGATSTTTNVAKTHTDIDVRARTADAVLNAKPHTERHRPVLPECGDHIRIYLEAQYALSFRSWLHAVQLDDPHLSAVGQDRAPGTEDGDEGRGGPVGQARTQAGPRPNLVPMSSTIGPTISTTGVAGTAGTVGFEGGSKRVKEAVGKVRRFNKVRMTLVGDRGEVLVVA